MDFRLPELGEGVYEAELVSWLVKAGDAVKRGQGLLEVMTDKATMEVPAPFAGTVTDLIAKPGAMLKIGEVVLIYQPVKAEVEDEKRKKNEVSTAASAISTPLPKAKKKASTGRMSTTQGTVRASPSVRLMARQLGIDLADVQGSGPQGRILIEDLSGRLGASRETTRTLAPSTNQHTAHHGKPGTTIKFHGVRRKIAEHMVHAKQTIPHFTYVDECEITDVVCLRTSLKSHFERSGLKLTFLSFFVKATVMALKDVPIVNATLDEKAGEIILHDRYDMGIAVAGPQGLIVPVLRDADKKDLAQIAGDIERLGSEARAGKSKLEDLRDSTFTITSIGSIGGLISTPIINHPEVGILGLGKVVKRPVYDTSGNIRPADIIYFSFSFDHRVIDGAVGAEFGNALIRHLQNPALFLLADKLA